MPGLELARVTASPAPAPTCTNQLESVALAEVLGRVRWRRICAMRPTPCPSCSG